MLSKDQQCGNEMLFQEIKIMEDVNDNELVLNSFEVVLGVNERCKSFHKTMRDIVERKYNTYFIKIAMILLQGRHHDCIL